jgi:hypothetical protein
MWWRVAPGLRAGLRPPDFQMGLPAAILVIESDLLVRTTEPNLKGVNGSAQDSTGFRHVYGC